MDIEELRGNWDALGRDQPISAIISSLGAGDEQAFFQSGRIEVAGVRDLLRDLALTPEPPVLDFGCGIGRLTQAFGEHFREVTGVDIAASMIERAREMNRFPDRCSYVLNERADLAAFEDGQFGFVYSSIVLQHVAPELTRRYVPELVRVLQPGGILFFQLPAELRLPAPLPGEAHQALLGLTGPPDPGQDLTASSGSPLGLSLSIGNGSPHVWTDEHRLSVGRRWLDARDGSLLVFADDGSRVALPAPLGPGEAVTVAIEVPVPTAPGRYLLELDLSQPGHPLFGDQGSIPLRQLVTVTPAHREPPRAPTGKRPPADTWLSRTRRWIGSRPDDAAPGPKVAPGGGGVAQSAPLVAHLEMHGIPRSEVLALLGDNGAELVAVLPDESAGPDWVSFRYVAVRR